MPAKEAIRTFNTIFSGLNLIGATTPQRSKWASIYYVLLIQNFPINIQRMIEISPYEIKRDNLLIGRKILLENGLIAQVLTQDVDIDVDEFDQIYLPVNPIIIWNENNNLIKEVRDIREKCAKKLKDQFIDRFKDHGFVGKFGDTGSITVLYSSQWFTYTILNNLNIKNNKNIDMMLSGLRSFDNDHIDSYRKMLSSGRKLTIRALFDPTHYIKNKEKTKKNEMKKKEFEERLDNARKLTTESEYDGKKFDGTIKIKYAKVTHATSRRVIFDRMAIDARKLLPFTRAEPSYVGTIYFNDINIKFLRENFDDSWNKSVDIDEYT